MDALTSATQEIDVARIEITYDTRTGALQIAGNVKDEVLMEGMLATARNILKDNYQIERIANLKQKAENQIIPIGVQ